MTTKSEPLGAHGRGRGGKKRSQSPSRSRSRNRVGTPRRRRQRTASRSRSHGGESRLEGAVVTVEGSTDGAGGNFKLGAEVAAGAAIASFNNGGD